MSWDDAVKGLTEAIRGATREITEGKKVRLSAVALFDHLRLVESAWVWIDGEVYPAAPAVQDGFALRTKAFYHLMRPPEQDDIDVVAAAVAEQLRAYLVSRGKAIEHQK